MRRNERLVEGNYAIRRSRLNSLFVRSTHFKKDQNDVLGSNKIYDFGKALKGFKNLMQPYGSKGKSCFVQNLK